MHAKLEAMAWVAVHSRRDHRRMPTSFVPSSFRRWHETEHVGPKYFLGQVR